MSLIVNSKLNRPLIYNIMLSSLDGYIGNNINESSRNRRNNGFGNTDDFNHMQNIVAKCDAVFIGSRTMMSEEGAFRTNKKQQPHWIIFSKTGSINWQHPFWKQNGIEKSIILSASDNITWKEWEVNIENDGISIPVQTGNIKTILQYMFEQMNIKNVALLGGGELNSFFWEHHYIDYLYLTLNSKLISNNNAPRILHSVPNHQLNLLKCTSKNNFIYLEYSVNFSEE